MMNKLEPSGAEAHTKKQDLIAALKALRHPRPGFSANRSVGIISTMMRHGWKPCPSRIDDEIRANRHPMGRV
jgi:hypothetical protein